MKKRRVEEDIYILAIESSCDETAAAVVKNGRQVLSNVISSQIALHTVYGGVVPEIASRKHIENINQVIQAALTEASMPMEAINAVAVTYGPGLVGALLVGVAEAKAIAYAAGKPLVGVHHIEGHVSANFIEHPDLEPPFICLIVSGGHTHLVVVKDYGEYEILGRTRDDAAGEAFDKVARAVGLGYPGGPKVDKAAKEGNPNAILFPRAKVEGAPYDFSFSGLKSAVLNHLNHARMMGEEIDVPDLTASFQRAVVDVLVDHTVEAAKELGYKKVAIAGGVASNSALRHGMKVRCEKEGLALYYPSLIYCTDNAAMIGAAGYYEYINGVRSGWDLNAVPNLKLGGEMIREKIVAIVLAAGRGTRMESNIQKQYMLLNGSPLICYSLQAFQKSRVDEIILVTGAGEEEYCRREIVEPYGFSKVVSIVPGGKERYHSVYEGLKAAGACDYVLIHDGARPCITIDMIQTAIEESKKNKACVIGMPVKDTIKISNEEGYAIATPDRSRLWMIQTPQAFSYSLVLNAYKRLFEKEEYQKGITDDAMVVEHMTATKVKLVYGSYENIKVTTPEDLAIAEKFLSNMEKGIDN